MSTASDDWKEEAYKAYVARLEEHEAGERAQRKRDGSIAIWLVSSPEDAATFTHEHQAELRSVVNAFRDQGMDVDAPFMAVDSVEAVSGYTGQLIVALAQVAAPAFTATLVAWLHGRSRRKVRVEFYQNGEIKNIEAQTPEQVVLIGESLKREAQAIAAEDGEQE